MEKKYTIDQIENWFDTIWQHLDESSWHIVSNRLTPENIDAANEIKNDDQLIIDLD